MNLQEAGGMWRIMFARLSHLNKAQFAEDIKRCIEMYPCLSYKIFSVLYMVETVMRTKWKLTSAIRAVSLNPGVKGGRGLNVVVQIG
jgi:hypothetical protein